MNITLEMARSATAAVVEETGADYKYLDHHDLCLYNTSLDEGDNIHDDAYGCIVGEALKRLGAHVVESVNGEGIYSVIESDGVRDADGNIVTVESAAGRYFNAAQWAQDGGRTHGAALGEAESYTKIWLK